MLRTIKIELEGKRFKVKKYRRCLICNKKIRCFIDEHTSFEDHGPIESIEVWQDKKAEVWCSECFENPLCKECGYHMQKINKYNFYCKFCNLILKTKDGKQRWFKVNFNKKVNY